MPESSGKEVLQLNGLSVSFGGLKAVSDFRLRLRESELCGLIGPNGAGKTTIFNLITGVYAPDTGDMNLDGIELRGLPPHEISKAGVARTFQNIRLYKDLSILENVLVSYHMQKPYGYIDSLLRTRAFYAAEKSLKEEALKLLSVVRLKQNPNDLAGSLSYGDQRRLEIARALATKPRVLLLDEPGAGLNSSEKVDLMSIVSKIRDLFKVTVLVIEHDMKFVMGICERILVLDHGELIAEGSPKEIQRNPKVIEAYLGVADA